MIASVPLQGTYLPYSICAKLPKKWIKFPSPCRGLIFLTISNPQKFKQYSLETVSVPLQGTYLPYQKIEQDKPKTIFAFPSPCRGLIFFTEDYVRKNGDPGHVSVPLQGTYLPYRKRRQPLLKHSSFRPLAGDLSSLPNVAALRHNDKFLFPSPCRGLIFLT